MAMRKAITIYTDEGCYIDAVNVTWLVKRENSEEKGVTMQNFRLKGNNAIYVPIKDAEGVPVKAWKEDIVLPSAQPEYKPVTAEDFAETMSKNTLYNFMAWHGEALALMKEQGFVICKKTM